ncbi:MAG: DUF1549 domain-containing protein [Planctomycetes bacterium]|nr:DUF1549 domain-containing protein [Planctomycetota bacterium]
MITNRSKQWWLLTAGAVVLAGFVFALTHDGAAQTKKTDPKSKTKKDADKTDGAAKKDAKVEPPPAAFPARKDQVESSQPGGSAMIHFIDEQITTLWKKNSTYPSDRCTDHEFIRRASLDIIGRIPTVEEIASFLKHPEYKRRAWLINELLDGKAYGHGAEFAQNYANLWTVQLMTRSGSGKHYQDQMNSWLYEQFKDGPAVKSSSSAAGPDWSKTAFQLIAINGETNKGDGRAANYLLHNLGEEQPRQERTENGKWDMIPATSRTTRLFLGVRTQCAQCHHHPFNDDLKQEHFWGINAFLRQIDTSPEGRPTQVGAKKKAKGVMGEREFTLGENRAFNPKGQVGYENRSAMVFKTKSSFLDGRKLPKQFEGSRREKLAEYVITSPYFSKAFVNRVWGHFLGISFTKGVADDFHEQNPISHPELFEKLSDEWAKNYRHNPKILIRWICNSQAYGLSSRANKWNDKQDDETLFTRMLLKPMTPEAMFASVTVATHANWQRYSDDVKADKLKAGIAWYKKLVDNFGNDEGEEGSYTGTVVQALLLMNGQETNKALTDKEGTVSIVEKKRGANYKVLPFVIQDLYMHALGRPATPKEVNDMTRWDPKAGGMFNFRFPPGTPAPNPNSMSAQFWSNYYQDIMWALLNSSEFILNH